MKVVYIGVFQTLNPSKEGWRCVSTYDFAGIQALRWASKVDAAHILTLCVARLTKADNSADALVEVKDDESQAELKKTGWSDYQFHIRKRREGIAACVVVDEEYPKRVAQALATRVAGDFCDKYPRSTFQNMTGPAKDGDFPLPEINTYIKQYKDPANADAITKIEVELAETKQVLLQNIAASIERGDKLEDMVNKSNEVSNMSKLFYTQAKKQNSCCVVM